MSLLSVGLLIHDEKLWNEVSGALFRLSCRKVADLRDVRSVDVAVNRIARTKPDIVFLEIREDQNGANLLIEDLRELDHPPVLVALHCSPTVDAVVAALRAGVNEFLHEPIEENLNAFINRMQNRRVRGEGKVVGFMSAKGGSGATTIACHAAVEIAERVAAQQKRSLLIDLDLNAGLAGFILKAQSEYSIIDAADSLQRLDIDYWTRLVQSPHRGLDVLPAPQRPNAKHPLNWEQVQSIIGFARRYYAWTTLDLGKGFGRMVSALLPELDQLIIVSTGEIGSLHGTRKAFHLLDESGYSRDRARLVINRVTGNGKAAVREVETATALPVFAVVPDDYEELIECYTSGRLLPRRNKLSAEIRALAARIIDEAPDPPKPRRSLMTALSACTSWISR